jgi:hypothetical protein
MNWIQIEQTFSQEQDTAFELIASDVSGICRPDKVEVLGIVK